MQDLSVAHRDPQQPRPNYKSTAPPESIGTQQQQLEKFTWALISSHPEKSQPSGGGKKKSILLPLSTSTAPSISNAPTSPTSKQKRLDMVTRAHAGGDQQVTKNGPPSTNPADGVATTTGTASSYEVNFGWTTTASIYNLLFVLMDLHFSILLVLTIFECVKEYFSEIVQFE